MIKNRVFIIHRWSGSPEQDWYPWLKKELEKNGFEIFVPAMPNTDEPKIEEWIPFLANIVGEPDENTYFVGHSIGCQTILRYLEKLNGKKVGGAIFVAGWFNLSEFTFKEEPFEEEEARNIAKPWIEMPINFEKIKKTTNNFVAIFSDNDPYVPIGDKNIFKEKLDSEIIIENNKGHFSGSDGITELPSVLNSLLKMAGKNI
jgi:predicted alpha/beta hydrolase family esterase